MKLYFKCLCIVFCSNIVAQTSINKLISFQDKEQIIRQWFREISFQVMPGKNLELRSTSVHWAVGNINVGLTENASLWLEYIPFHGPSKWLPTSISTVPFGPSYGPETAWVGGMGSSRVIGDEDGRGLRLWDKTRTILIAQHFFDDLNPNDLELRLETAPGGGMLVQASHPAKPRIFVAVRYSLDGEQWSYPRHTVLFANPAHRRAPEKREDFRLHSAALAKNAKPWVEVDVMLGLYRIRKRFQYGVSDLPLKDGVLPPGKQSEFKHGQLERDQKARDEEFKEQRESMDKGLPWTPKPKRIKSEEELLLDWGNLILDGK